LKTPADAYAFGVVAAEAAVDAIDLLETIGESRRGQDPGREPTGHISEARHDNENQQTDDREPDHCNAIAG